MSEKISRRNFLRTATLGAAAAGLLAGCGNSAVAGSTAAGTYTAGTYSATATGINTTTPVTVTMTFNADAITDVQIDVANDIFLSVPFLFSGNHYLVPVALVVCVSADKNRRKAVRLERVRNDRSNHILLRVIEVTYVFRFELRDRRMSCFS